MISATFPYEKKQREVLGRNMASVDEGQHWGKSQCIQTGKRDARI